VVADVSPVNNQRVWALVENKDEAAYIEVTMVATAESSQ
jgi:hypothetical protein